MRVRTALLFSYFADVANASMATCRDTPGYNHNGGSYSDCTWVADSDKCMWTSIGRVIGTAYCPVSCNMCDGDDIIKDVVGVDKPCYDYGEHIIATFANEDPQYGDWIGLYPSGDLSSLGAPSLWLSLCGNQQDDCLVSYGALTFGSGAPQEAGTTTFPLDEGNYLAVLVRATQQPYMAYVASVEFTVQPDGSSCFSSAPEAGDPAYTEPEPSVAPVPEPYGDPTVGYPQTVPSPHPESAPTVAPVPTPTVAPVAPVPAPTLAPYGDPTVGYPVAGSTESPESSATDALAASATPYQTPVCTASIATDKACYVKGDAITVTFEQCDEHHSDWLGVYDANDLDENTKELGYDYRLWAFACGNQECRGTASTGTIVFDENYPKEKGKDAWPLKSSSDGYQVHLIRYDRNSPIKSYVASNEFVVLESGDCPSEPSSVPAPISLAGPPTSCTDTVVTNSTCYSRDDDDGIAISFNNCDLHPDTWLGIYRQDEDPTNLGLPTVLWSWLCGSKTCDQAVDSGTITIDHALLDESSNFVNGDYRVHLVSGVGDGGYQAYASSETFRVQNATCVRRQLRSQ